MAYPNLNITVTQNQLGRKEPDLDNVAALLIVGLTAAMGFDEWKTYFSLEAAERDGIDTAYETTSGLLSHFHISEFFRKNPNGELWVMAIDDTVNPAFMFEDTYNVASIKKICRATQGRIKQVAVALNSAADVSQLYTSLVAKAQDCAHALAEEMKPIDCIFLEGWMFNYSASTAADFRTKNAPNVAVVIGQDPVVQANFVGTSAVGTVLGSSTNKPIHESFAWAKDENSLTSEAAGRFLKAQIYAGGNDISTMLDSEFEVLHSKGYVFPRLFPNAAGIFWAQSNNCVAESNDYNSIELIQVINKAQRILYSTMRPYVNKNFDVTTTGRITNTERKSIEQVVLGALERGMGDSYSKLSLVLVDPAKDNQNNPFPSILVDRVLRVIVGFIPKGKAETIFITVGFVSN